MSWAIWITDARGRASVARAAAARLTAAGTPVTVLEVDALRRAVTPTPIDDATARDLAHRALVWLAATCVEAGVPVVVDAGAPRREWLDLARAVIGELTEVDTTAAPVAEAAGQVCALARRLPAPPARAAGAGWAIWITGRPGSGKTTIASAASELLAADGVAVRMLELGDVLGFIAGGGSSPEAQAVASAALVYGAALLSDAGLAVLVDAAAPPRACRERARALIPRFAEVQLSCPPEVCARRERAGRGRLMGCASAPPRRSRDASAPASVYEPALRPDLTIETDVDDAASAAAAVVRLARRLAIEESPWTTAIAG